MNVIFNSSLPRSGSTLLQNILAQNPSIYCSPTSGVIELLYAARQNFTNLNEFKLDPDQESMKRGWLSFCRSAIHGWYSGITDKPIACDKSRGWMYYWNWLIQFMPDAKLICCVRDPVEILASMEALHRKNMHLHDPADAPGNAQFVTIDQRVNHWLNSPPVGLGLMRLKDSIDNGNAKQFHFVRYEDIVSNPEKEMENIYSYLGVQPFKHHYDSMQQTVLENDALHGVYGSHKIRPDLGKSKISQKEILRKAVCEQVKIHLRWYYDYFNP
jgi:sulfotransferase